MSSTSTVSKTDYSRAASLNLIFDSASIAFFPIDKVKNGAKLLFAGCGNGKLVIEIAKKIKELNVKIVAFDVSEQQLCCARTAAREEGLCDIVWMKHDIHNLTHFKGEFDFVHARFILNHLPTARQVTKDLCATLVENGIFIAEEFSGYEMDVNSKIGEHTSAIRAWEQGVILQHAKQCSDISFANKLPKILGKIGMQVIRQAKPNPVASTSEQKNIFPQCAANANRIFASVFHPAIEILENQLEFVRDSNCSIIFKHFTQIEAQKNPQNNS